MNGAGRSFISREKAVALALLGALLVAAPLVLDRYFLSVFILVFWSAYVGQAWNVMMGFAGLLSLGHALYVGVAAYIAAALYVHFGLSPLIGLVPAAAACMGFGAAIGWLGFRFRIEGVYFALLTIAFAEATRIAFDNSDWTGGAGGLFISVSSATAGQWWNLRGGPLLFYYLALAMAAAAFLFCALLMRSPLGYRWLAVREDPEAARALGVDVLRVRLASVIVSAAMTSLAGVFYAFYYNNVFTGQIFDISRSIEIILAPIIGGVGTLFGPILGAFVLIPLGQLLLWGTQALGLDAPGLEALLYGLCLMIIVTRAPEGVWPRLERLLRGKDEAP
ncbi:MAG TPA: branched-chain amino acid ABC transporter permease [Beijerinckiaceae bacterium]|nr:branched-chain amino acid ABC transporter permease [Beijerinckiaceae bacterium]